MSVRELTLEERIGNARISLRRMRHAAMSDPFDRYTGDLARTRRHTWDTMALLEPGRPTRVMLTLDVGTHASGWWRNSEYDRCLHLSLSHPVVDETRTAAPVRLEALSEEEVRCWGIVAFGEERHKCWNEPPASAFDIHGRRPGVWHVRLFLDRHNQPIQPTGEVYTLKPWDDGTSPEKVMDRRGY